MLLLPPLLAEPLPTTEDAPRSPLRSLAPPPPLPFDWAAAAAAAAWLAAIVWRSSEMFLMLFSSVGLRRNLWEEGGEEVPL